MSELDSYRQAQVQNGFKQRRARS